MTRRKMIVTVYALVAAILLLSGLCLIGLTQQNTPETTPPAPTFAPAPTETAHPITEETFQMQLNEPTVVYISPEDEKRLALWESSDTTILSVDSGGRLDAAKTGVAQITARFQDGDAAVYTVTVTNAQPQTETDLFSTAITANADILEQNKLGNQDLYHINVNREQNIVTVYTYDSSGQYTVPIRAMVCSCGLNKATILGEFDTYFRTEWQQLFNDVYGKYVTGIDGDYLFHSVPYTENFRSDSLETEEYNKLGEEASLGCVRLAVGDAKWIYENCPVGTHVKIYDSQESEPLGKPEPMRITNLNNGWDPTDNMTENPYNDQKPTISTPQKTELTVGENFDILNGVTATDSCGNDITEKIETFGNVVTSRQGDYKVTYRVTDALHRNAEQTFVVHVE